MTHAFISYVRDDQHEVDRMCAVLRSAGVNVWLDREQIKPGQRWRRVIREAIRTGGYFVACFSRRSVGRSRTYMNEELALAIDELRQMPADRTWFIPILLSQCEIPDSPIGGGETLRDLHRISFFADWDSAIGQLLDALDIRSGEDRKSEVHRLGDPLLDAAWDAYLAGTDERRLYRLEEAAGLGHPKVKEELLRIPVNQHCLAIARLAPFPEYVSIAIRELMTTYDQSNHSAMDFLGEAGRRIPNEIEERHLMPTVAIASDLADFQDNEMATCFGALVWFVGTVGNTHEGIRDNCRRILHLIGELDLDEWHRNEVNEAVARLDSKLT